MTTRWFKPKSKDNFIPPLWEEFETLKKELIEASEHKTLIAFFEQVNEAKMKKFKEELKKWIFCISCNNWKEYCRCKKPKLAIMIGQIEKVMGK